MGMNTKTLIYSIVGIFALAAVAFFIISPIATKTLDAPVIDTVGQTTDQTPSTTGDAPAAGIATPTKPSATPSTPAPKPSQPAPTTPVQPTPMPSEPVAAPGYTASEVVQHSSESSCWSIINGNVYDLTSYVPRHPGGKRQILNICGRDGTSLFEGQHGGESKPEKILAGYLIGPLK